MIKKISAIILALVLCLSVVVVPASALSDDKLIEYRVELDSDTYKAGDTVTVNLYINVADGYEWGAMTFVLGVSDVFVEPGENETASIKESSVSNDLVMSFYKDPAGQSWAWQTNATVLTNITGANTAEENAMYSDYLKFAFARSTSGSHEYANTSGTKNGLTADEINGETAPAISFDLTLRDDLEDGAEINVGVTSGSITKYGFAAYYTQPGVKTTTYKVTAAESDFVVGNATIGSAKEYEASIVSYWKDQIKMDNSEYTSFSIRHLAQIEASVWESTFGTDEDKDATGTKNITDIGFIFQKGDGFDKDAAANWLEAGATDDSFTKAKVNFVSTGMKEDYYVFSCTITNMSDPDAALSSLGYVVWVDDANTTHYSYFENVETETFRDLYDRYVAAH